MALPTAPAAASAAVLPSAPRATLRRLEWRLRHAVSTSLNGDYRSAFRGRGMEFDQVVKYQWGDDLRDIDWNVTARLGEPYRKKFVEERELSLIFVFEDSPALQFGSGARSKRQALMEVTALLMLLGSFNRDRIGFFYCAPGEAWFQPPMFGRKGTLRTAARLLNQPPPSLERAPHIELPWRTIRRVAHNGSIVLWLGAFEPGDTPEGWRGLQQRCQTVGVRAQDAWDEALPQGLRLSTYDPLAGRLVNLDSSSRADRAAHARWRAQREDCYERLFPTRDARLGVPDEEDPLQVLMRYFHQHGRSGGRG